MVAYSAVIDTPPGRLALQTTDTMLVGVDYIDKRTPLKKPQSRMAKEVVKQLQNYFNDSAFVFDLPIQLDGTVHQKKVWQMLRKIRPGITMTYGELASHIKSGARAVGNSCRRNPVSVVIPCHRVVEASGIGGYSGHTDGETLNRKYWLLEHEGLKFPN